MLALLKTVAAGLLVTGVVTCGDASKEPPFLSIILASLEICEIHSISLKSRRQPSTSWVNKGVKSANTL